MPPDRQDERWLVTGASGFVGCALAGRLEEASHLVWRLSRNAAGPRSIPWDLTGSDRQDWPSELEVDAVCHAAGLAHVVPRTAADRDRFFAVNVDGTRRLLHALEGGPGLPARFILISTVAVYGRERGNELDEQTPREAADPYGSSRRIAEDVVVDWCEARGVRWCILRLPLVVGRGAPGNLKAMVEGLRSGAYFGVGAGDARRSMVVLDDVAAILPTLAFENGAFHLTDGRHPSFREIEEALASALGVRAPRRLPLGLARRLAGAGSFYESITRRAFPFTKRTLGRMTSTLTFSDRKARRELGWAPASVSARLSELA